VVAWLMTGRRTGRPGADRAFNITVSVGTEVC
jgi:hypothetical protein